MRASGSTGVLVDPVGDAFQGSFSGTFHNRPVSGRLRVAQYEHDGYVCPVDAFSTERTRAWRDRLEAFERAEGQKMTRGHNFKPHLLFPWVDEIVHAFPLARR